MATRWQPGIRRSGESTDTFFLPFPSLGADEHARQCTSRTGASASLALERARTRLRGSQPETRDGRHRRCFRTGRSWPCNFYRAGRDDTLREEIYCPCRRRGRRRRRGGGGGGGGEESACIICLYLDCGKHGRSHERPPQAPSPSPPLMYSAD